MLKPLNPKVRCVDGFEIGIQASRNHYCHPREDQGPYTHVECGYPSSVPLTQEFLDFAESSSRPTYTVYAYVPVEIVRKELAAHGGIDFLSLMI